MSTLVQQINEMLEMLEVIDPTAAGKIRIKSGLDSYQSRKAGAQGQPQPYVSPFEKSETPPMPDEITQTSRDSKNQGTTIHPLLFERSGENLVQGIILAEILGKPVSRRRRYHLRNT